MTEPMFTESSILEVARLDVNVNQTDAFEAAFAEARQIISAMPGYR
jgi:heme-degrading monooxygenase HmoA